MRTLIKPCLTALVLMVTCPAVVLPVVAQPLSVGVATELNRAIKAQKTAPQQAIAALSKTPARTPYEKAMVNRVLGALYYQIGALSQAISHLSMAADSGGFKKATWQNVQRTLADLLLASGQPAEALERYHTLVSGDHSPPEADSIWLRIGQAHYLLAEWQSSLSALARIQRADKRHTVSVLSLKLGSLLQLERWPQTVPLLNELIDAEPAQSRWWRHLISVYQRLNQPKAVLKTLVLMERQGLILTPQERRVMSHLYAAHGSPEKAARTLGQLTAQQMTVKDIATQAQFFQQAKAWEQAIAQWKRAAEKDRAFYWPLARLQRQQGHDRDAIESLKNVDDPSRQREKEIALMMAYERLGSLDAAYRHASQAHAIAPSEQTSQWLAYLSKKRAIAEEK